MAGRSSIQARLFAVAAALALLLPQMAQAAMLTFAFSARIDDPSAPLPVGTLIAGTFGYDPATPPFYTGPYGSGAMGLYFGEHFLITAAFAGGTYPALNGTATVIDDDPGSFALLAFADDYLLAITLFYPSGALPSGVGLPTSFPLLAQGPFADPFAIPATSAYGTFEFDTVAGPGSFTATLLAIGPGAVPEPGTWLLTVAGLGALGTALRRRQARRPLRTR